MKNFIQYCNLILESILLEDKNQEDFLKHAISDKLIISLTYDNHNRLIEPYILGFSLKGNLILRAYQIGGGSSKGEGGWRTFLVSKMKDLSYSEEKTFKIRSDYTESDRLMTEIITKVTRKAPTPITTPTPTSKPKERPEPEKTDLLKEFETYIKDTEDEVTPELYKLLQSLNIPNKNEVKQSNDNSLITQERSSFIEKLEPYAKLNADGKRGYVINTTLLNPEQVKYFKEWLRKLQYLVAD